MNLFTFAKHLKLLFLTDQGNKTFSVGIKKSGPAILWLTYESPKELFVHTRFSQSKAQDYSCCKLSSQAITGAASRAGSTTRGKPHSLKLLLRHS